MSDSIAHTANIIVLGDSFVNRLESSLSYDFVRSPASKIMCMNEYARDALKCPLEVNRVYFHGSSGAGLTSHVNKTYTIPHDYLMMLRPKYAILEIGGNDVDSTAPVDLIVSNRIRLATQILSDYDVYAVSLSTITPRDTPRHLSPDQFREKALEVNIKTNKQSTPPIYFHKHVGFWRDESGTPTDTTCFSTDGVHPNTPEGIHKYRKSITKCMHNLIKSYRRSLMA